MDVAIRVENLTKVFTTGIGKKIEVFKNIDLEIFKGEVFGLLGLNGAGKTTLIKILIGLISPTDGYVWIFGKRVGHKEIRRKIGFLPEMPYFPKYFTAEEILYFYGRLFGYDKEFCKNKINEVLEIVKLSKKDSRRKLIEYSKGMLQKVGMAQLIINDPELLFLDEPTFGLDPLMCKEMRDLILLMKNKKKTIFLSSHQISEIEKVCDRIGILHDKKIIKVSEVVDKLEEFFIKSVSS